MNIQTVKASIELGEKGRRYLGKTKARQGLKYPFRGKLISPHIKPGASDVKDSFLDLFEFQISYGDDSATNPEATILELKKEHSKVLVKPLTTLEFSFEIDIKKLHARRELLRELLLELQLHSIKLPEQDLFRFEQIIPAGRFNNGNAMPAKSYISLKLRKVIQFINDYCEEGFIYKDPEIDNTSVSAVIKQNGSAKTVLNVAEVREETVEMKLDMSDQIDVTVTMRIDAFNESDLDEYLKDELIRLNQDWDVSIKPYDLTQGNGGGADEKL